MFFYFELVTDPDDYTDLSKILERYDCDNKQIKGGCYYFIDETQLFRVKHVLSYLEANRQVGLLFPIIFHSIFLKAASLISSYTNEDVTFKDRLDQIQVNISN